MHARRVYAPPVAARSIASGTATWQLEEELVDQHRHGARLSRHLSLRLPPESKSLQMKGRHGVS